jgi:antitoxin component YwqK of YwqJK toxin-antitoxin module
LKSLFYLTPLLLWILGTPPKKTYVKQTDTSGRIMAEGWMKGDTKQGYWRHYHPNGTLASQGNYHNDTRVKYWYFYHENEQKLKEGHYKAGIQVDWWIYYNEQGQLVHKCQLKNNQKNGYCLKYKNQRLIAASKFRKGIKIKEWTDFSAFTKENGLSDLN